MSRYLIIATFFLILLIIVTQFGGFGSLSSINTLLSNVLFSISEPEQENQKHHSCMSYRNDDSLYDTIPYLELEDDEPGVLSNDLLAIFYIVLFVISFYKISYKKLILQEFQVIPITSSLMFNK